MTAQRQVAQAAEVPKRQIIVPIGRDAGWLDARELVREKGGLPSNVMHDNTLVYSDDWKALRKQGYYAAWTREVLVYPEVNGKFAKGKDVVDAFTDEAERQWIFPASSIPEVAIGKEKVALFVDPQNVEIDGKRVVILAQPEAITVLTPFMQKNGWGKVDEKSRVPLEADLKGVPANQHRYLWRIDGQGVRPLARYDGDVGGRRDVYAGRRRDGRLGVASVELAAELSQTEPKQAAFARQVTPEVIAPLLRDARGAKEILAQTSKAELLKPLESLFRALEIKE